MFDRQDVVTVLRDAFLEGFQGYLDQWGDRIDGSLGGEPWGRMADEVLELTRPISARQVQRLRRELAEALSCGEGELDYERADSALPAVMSFFGLRMEK